MELDSGAGVSIWLEELVKLKFAHLQIFSTFLKLTTYDGYIIKPFGEIIINTTFGKKEENCKLLVVQNGCRALLDRDAMNILGLGFVETNTIKCEE